MATSTGTLGSNLDPGYRLVFFNWIKEHPWEYKGVFNVLNSERAYEEDLLNAGLGAVPEKPQGTPTTYDDPIQGNAVRYTHITYALGFRTTREMADDDLYGTIQKTIKSLARSAKHTLETIAWDILNDAFDSDRPGQDGVELCSTAHVMLDGSTQSNRPTTDIDLTVTGLEQALDNFERQTDHRSLPIAINAKWVVIPPELRWRATEIIESPQRSDTANEAKNAFMQMSLDWTMSHYLTSSTAWFVTSNPDEHDMKMYERDGLEFKTADDFDTGDAKSWVRFRCSAGHTIWQGSWGSPGGAG